MIVDAFWLAAGLVVIIKGGDLFVSASVRAAEFLRLPRVVIGSTLVSPATASRGRISRRAGAGLLVLYAGYLAGLTMLAAAVRP